ncbi:MAG: hypothetical protein VKP62_01080 [Candidatus Sericytochromatia bacterium]|nr:hypothetical protein [Candidatus Sericytochromatia bacterium]
MSLRCTFCLIVLFAVLPRAAWGAVEEPDADRQRRIDAFQDRRLIIESDAKDAKNPSPKDKSASPAPLQLRQGPDRIFHVDFVELMDDPSLTRDWEWERNKDWAWWLGSGLVGLPLGGLLFYQNFRGEGPLALFSSGGGQAVSGAADWRSFTLSVTGAALSMFATYQLGQWFAETLDVSHPDRLEALSITPRVTEWNERLGERLNLDPSEWPSPPPPRPSATPTPSPSPGASPTGAPTAAPMVGGPDANPYGTEVPVMPTPLPLASPGSLVLPSPAPSPRPTGRSPFFRELP